MNESQKSRRHWQRTTTRRLLLWLISWKTVRRVLLTIAGLVTLVALFYAEENWRGQRAWENYKREWEAKGERFDLAAFIPKPVPDDLNLAMTPLLRPLFDYEITTNGMRWRDKEGYERITSLFERTVFLKLPRGVIMDQPPVGLWQIAQMTDFNSWTEYFRLSTNYPGMPHTQNPAADVLAALSKYDPVLNELRAACQRPYAQFPLHWDQGAGILLPHLVVLKRINQTLQLHALAALAAGQADKAWTDMNLSFRLANALTNEPILFSWWLRGALYQITLQPIWEGMAAHRWSEPQLASLQRELSVLNTTNHYLHAIRGGRALFNSEIENQWNKWCNSSNIIYGGNFSSVHEALNYIINRASKYMPLGWLRQNQLLVNQYIQTYLTPDAKPSADELKRRWARPTPYNIVASWIYPRIYDGELERMRTEALEEMPRLEVSLNLALAGCSLERYRLARGAYPGNLDALIPDFIDRVPPDAFNGQPLKYHRADDGLFVLYSVGRNGVDDGGALPQLTASGRPDLRTGDWVWRYPVKSSVQNPRAAQ